MEQMAEQGKESVAARGIFRCGQVFEKLGVVENILGSHTQKN